MNKKTVIFIVTCVAFMQSVVLQAKNTFGNVITEEGAWCWFADPRAIHYQNKNGTINSTYIGYIDVHGNVKATQINHLTNVKNEVLIRSYFQPDDHNNPTFLVLPDERVMIFYTRHTDERRFYYRISRKPGDITTLGEEKILETANGTTYPSPFILSDDPNHIYLCWRGISWHPTIARLTIPDANDNSEFEWGPYQMVKSQQGSGGVRPYAKYVSNGKDKIYLAYTTTHPDNQPVNYIYCNYFDINSQMLNDIKGNKLSKVGDSELHTVYATQDYKLAHPYAVVDDSPLRNWLWEIVLDKDEKPVIATVGISHNKESHDYYYAKWTGEQWQKTFLSNAGGHFHQAEPVTERCYSGGMAIDKYNPQVIYGSVPVEGKHGRIYELKKFTIATDGTLSSTEQLTFDSEKNNSRPFMITNKEDEKPLVWMYGDYFDWIVNSSRPKGYPTAIHTNMAIPATGIDLKKGLQLEQSSIKLSVDDKHKLKVKSSKSFTVVLSLSIDTATYHGEIILFANLTYTLPKDTLPKPYLTYKNRKFVSTNVLGSSDVWKEQSRSTNGQWYEPTKLDTVQLAFSYENGTLRTFINGLIDQAIEIKGLQISDITLGAIKGEVNNIKVYNRALNQDEVKALEE